MKIIYDLQMADDSKQQSNKETEETEVSDVIKSDESEVVEGEVVADSESEEELSAQEKRDQAKLILNLENLIRNNNVQVAKLSAELAEARDMLKDAFENDVTYKEHADAAKEANKVKSATKAQILRQPQVAGLAAKVKSLTSEVKELKEGMSDYLKEFNRLSGINEIEGEDGELMEIVYVAKLVKKTR